MSKIATVMIVVTSYSIRGQFQVEESHPKCGERQCVVISKCPSILRLVLEVKSGSSKAKRQLLSSQCGFERTLPKVCCDVESKVTERPRIFVDSGRERSPLLSPKRNKENSSTTESSTVIAASKITPRASTSTLETRPSSNRDPPPFTTPSPSDKRPTMTNSPPPVFISRTRPTSPVEKLSRVDERLSRLGAKENLAKLNHPKCGVRNSLNTRITFGLTASPGQFPWVASLMYSNRQGTKVPLCGGALISEQHVLTAAHCDASQSGFSLSSVVLGLTDISSEVVAAPGIELKIARVVRHPKFRRNPVAEMDIALIKLVRPVQFSAMIIPICLFPGISDLELDEVENPARGLVVAGWGRTESAKNSDLLQYTFLKPVDRKTCMAGYSNIPGLKILESQLCAQGAGSTDSCTGDSGGPLMAQTKDNTWYLAGVVSFGTLTCDSSLPGIYTRTSSFYQWILDTMRTV